MKKPSSPHGASVPLQSDVPVHGRMPGPTITTSNSASSRCSRSRVADISLIMGERRVTAASTVARHVRESGLAAKNLEAERGGQRISIRYRDKRRRQILGHMAENGAMDLAIFPR